MSGLVAGWDERGGEKRPGQGRGGTLDGAVDEEVDLLEVSR